MIEAKQLGLVSNNVQKLDYEWNNLRAGCYGKEFWVVYDFYRGSKNAQRWFSHIDANVIPDLKKEKENNLH